MVHLMRRRGVAALTSLLLLASVAGGAPAAAQDGDRIVAIDAGSLHTCALHEDGSVWCWGSRYAGVLGDGRTDGSSTTPVRVATVDGPLDGVVAISAGNQHTCALRDDGSAWCWGRDEYGQLGDGIGPGGGFSRALAVRMLGRSGPLTGIRQVAANGLVTFALLADGTVFCWGSTDLGQCGNGLTGYGGMQLVPQRVRTAAGILRHVVSISAGGGQHCAIRRDTTAWCWGWDRWGAVGDGRAGADRRVAVPVRAPDGSVLRDVRQILAGAEHTCALRSPGRTWCWGGDRYGQLGDGTRGGTDHLVAIPQRVLLGDGLLTRVALLDGYLGTCALRDDGAAWCWGDASRGQVGDGTHGDAWGLRRTPVRVRSSAGPLTDIVDLAVQRHHGCALDSSGTVWCWGANRNGQLGDGTRVDRALAVRMATH